MRAVQGAIATVTLALSLGAGSTAWATNTSSTSFFWQFQDTGFNGTNQSAIAMRNGHAWPVVFDDFGDVYSLFSTENPQSNTNWHQIGTNVAGNPNPRIRAASSVDGRVAAAYGQFEDGVVTNLPTGFTALPGVVSVAFDPTGALVTADINSVSGFAPPPVIGQIIDIAVSVNGDVGVIDSAANFHELSPLLGTWQSFDLNSISFNANQDSMSLAYDSRGRPHVVGIAGPDAVAADFDQQTGTWSASTISGGLSVDSQFLELAGNDNEVVGTAFVSQNNLYYGFNDANAGWSFTLVQTNVDFSNLQGITYDFDGLPVIAYTDQGNLHVAYDPIVVPEPAALALLGVGGLLLVSRRALR